MAPASNATPRLIVLILLVINLSLSQSIQASDRNVEEEDPTVVRVPKLGTSPLAVVTLSSLQRSREKFEVLCEIAGHPKTAQDIISGIDKATDSLAGIDQSLPGGVAVFLDSIFPPAFEFVAFIPLSDTDAFMRTLERGPIIASPVTGEEGRYELLGPTQTSQVRVQNGYAFIQLPIMKPGEAFERQLFDPVTPSKGQTSQFDISVTLDVESVPKATRNLFLSFLTSTMSTQMQQRDNEADGLYEMRRAWMQGDIDALKLFLGECRQITIGISTDTEQRLINVDFLIDVQEGSDLLNEIFESVTQPSYFTPILNDDAAVSLSISQVLPDRDRERYIGVLDGFKKELSRQITLKDLGPELDDASPVFSGLTALQDTLSEGHFDAFGQCYADSEGNLVVIGAVRVLKGETISVGLNDMFNRLQGQNGWDSFQVGYGEHAGIQFHRIGFADADPGRDAVLGPDSGFVFGSGPRSMWFGLGGGETIDTVASVMDQLQAAYEQPTQPAHSSNMRVVVNTGQLIQLGETARKAQAEQKKAKQTEAGSGKPFVEAADPKARENQSSKANSRIRSGRRQRFRETQGARQASWRQTFAEGGDRIRMDFQPTRNGARFRIELGEAFLKGIVRAMTVTRQHREENE